MRLFSAAPSHTEAIREPDGAGGTRNCNNKIIVEILL
jgi:hypothetical protein